MARRTATNMVKAMVKQSEMDSLLADIRACRLCADFLPHGPRPVLQASVAARIAIVGQAPGRHVHESGIPFDDPSGDRLRHWLGIDKTVFYDNHQIAIIPMGFCYPGTGKSGDLPPRPECAQAWRKPLLALLPNIELTVVIGRYAIDWHLDKVKAKTLTETVKNWRTYWPSTLVLPHPSPRNNIWLKKNPWFEEDLLPPLRQKVREIIVDPDPKHQQSTQSD